MAQMRCSLRNRSEKEKWETMRCRTKHIKRKRRRGINAKFVNMFKSLPKLETKETPLS